MERKTKIDCLYLQSRLTCLVMKECELIEGFDSDQSNQKQGQILLSAKLAYHESMTWTAYPKLAYPYLATCSE